MRRSELLAAEAPFPSHVNAQSSGFAGASTSSRAGLGVGPAHPAGRAGRASAAAAAAVRAAAAAAAKSPGAAALAAVAAAAAAAAGVSFALGPTRPPPMPAAAPILVSWLGPAGAGGCSGLTPPAALARAAALAVVATAALPASPSAAPVAAALVDVRPQPVPSSAELATPRSPPALPSAPTVTSPPAPAQAQASIVWRWGMGRDWRLTNQEPSPAVAAAAAARAGCASVSGAAKKPPPPPKPVSYKEGASYAVYGADCEPSSLAALLRSLDEQDGAAPYDVVLLGEYHDDAVAHHLQLLVLRHMLGVDAPAPSAAASGSGGSSSPGSGPGGARRPVALSLEMFERDVQAVMDEYLAGVITEADLMKDARPWPNYTTDYAPLVAAAKKAGARVVCANAPRRHVSLVGRSGSEALSALPEGSRAHLPPLPLRPPSERYVAKIKWTMQKAREPPAEAKPAPDTAAAAKPAPDTAAAAKPAPDTAAAAKPSGPAPAPAPEQAAPEATCPHIGLSMRANFFEAQNLWDASMAHAIATELAAGRRVVHVCGKFHSEQRLGIVEHLEAAAAAAGAPAPRVCIVTFVPSGRGPVVPSRELVGAGLHTYGDWLVLTDGNAERSFESQHPV
ncbi:hypothetical protein HYH03_007167 [Edaphochlamys debaryana]|uniref:Haem-binding uptake Tiki superfamily ChaN domain-containing protein n=1 Tax=Edaphochlamys debaryana TaxID=47281 RepID=A0A836BZC6_9CHLO|nr:hypothetical protein HYH03_007167 [Edaphochlamys debaryana]|eukprot:KAG2494651.1 hypothetical protein HYH03_007167 [Edaphochlamys debaryana]